MILKLQQIVRITRQVGSIRDRRVIINRTTASYLGEDGQEYRKTFESKGEPVVPKVGNHENINHLKYQYEIKGKKNRDYKKSH